MSKTLTEVDTFTANVVVPEDSIDFRTAASIEGAFQALTNRTRSHFTRLNAIRTLFGLPGALTESVRLIFPVAYGEIPTEFGGTRWSLSNLGTVPHAINSDVTDAAAYLYIPLPGLPQRWWIDGFGVQVDGGSGHSDLPATLPLLRLQQNDLGGSETASLTVADTSTPLAAYEANHAIERYNTGTDVKLAIGSGTTFHLELQGEAGANALANELRCISAWVRITATEPV